MPTRHRTLLLFTVVCTLCVGAAELLLRRGVGPRWSVESHALENAIMGPHPIRGYGLVPERRVEGGRSGWTMEVRTNAWGLRDSPPSEFLASPVRVVAVGDSFTFGLAVDLADAWVQRLEARLSDVDGSVVNGGVPAYNPVQMRQMAEELVPKVRPQALVYALYAASFWRCGAPYALKGAHLVTAKIHQATELSAAGDLILTRFPPGPLRRLDVWMKQYFYLGANLLSIANRFRHWPDFGEHVVEADVDAVRERFACVLEQIDRTRAFAESQGALFVVLLVNHQEADGSFAPVQQVYNQVVTEHAAAAGYAVADPLPLLVAYAEGEPIFRLGRDMHWSPLAHRVAANLVYDALVGEGVVPGP